MFSRKSKLAAVAALTGFLCFTAPVMAAPVQMADGNIFDAEFYAATYPDEAAALGTDAQVLYQHYLLAGKQEGRLPYAASAVSTSAAATTGIDYTQKKIDVFSALVINGRVYENGKIVAQTPTYVKAQSDSGTLEAWGYGIEAHQDESALFDANAYAAVNPDVAAALGTTKGALWEHYKTNGAAAGRKATGTSSNANAKLEVIRIAQEITNDSMSAREKVKTVHDWIINNTTYDLSFADASQNIEGLIYNHTAVCAGYSKTFDYFMEVLDIPCDYITGYAKGESHAWNRVMLDGQWYYIDVTWDDPVYRYNGVRKEVCRDTYFLISEAQMAQDHQAENIW